MFIEITDRGKTILVNTVHIVSVFQSEHNGKKWTKIILNNSLHLNATEPYIEIKERIFIATSK